MDDLLTSQSIEGHAFPDVEMFDAKIASALKRIITDQYFRRRINVKNSIAQKYDRFLRGRQIVFLIFEHFLATGAHEAAMSLYKEMTFRISIQDGTKLCYLQVKYPRKTSWRVCTR